MASQTSMNTQVIRPSLQNHHEFDQIPINAQECLPVSPQCGVTSQASSEIHVACSFVNYPADETSQTRDAIRSELSTQVNIPVFSEGDTDFPPVYNFDAEEIAQRLSSRPPTYHDAMNSGLIPPPLYNETFTEEQTVRRDLPPPYESLQVYPGSTPNSERTENSRSNAVQYIEGHTVNININNQAAEQKRNRNNIGYWIAMELILLGLLVYLVMCQPYTPGMWVTVAVFAAFCIKASVEFLPKKIFHIYGR